MPNFAVLLMAYGTPNSEDEMESYLTDIRRGRKPTPSAVSELNERYKRIGGSSPLLTITNAQASALEKSLSAQGLDARVYVGMKHWHPYVREVVPKIVNDGLNYVVALALAPHYSQISIGGYKGALDQAAASTLQVDFVDSWYDEPLFHKSVAEKVEDGLKLFPNSNQVEVLFTAHSLPERILLQNDPYPTQLRSSCQSVASLSKLEHWSFAYQSAGQTGEKWLGPDILEALQNLSTRHVNPNVLVVPIGFVADHLEILYDIDIEAQEFSRAHGLTMKRTESLNTSPTFISALAEIIARRAKAATWS